MPDPSEAEPAGGAEERDAVLARVWRRGDGPTRRHSWPRGSGPRLEVRVDGQWRAARLVQREDRTDGTVLVHVDIHLPGYVGEVRRTYAYDPAAIRPVEDAHTPAFVTEWDAEGRSIGEPRPSA